jgi:hypothetical protein
MHRDNITLRELAGRGRQLCSKQFATELHEQGYSREGAIDAVSQVFGVPHRAARLFVASHPAWVGEAPLTNRNGSLFFTL